jgi:acyl dehydratase
MVQGLLTATLPSKIGGDLDFIAGEMTFRFLRPVFVGDSVACEVTIEDLSESAGRLHLACRWTCSNQDGDVVMTGGARGVILDRRPPAGIDP